MYHGADQKQAELESFNEVSGPVFKIKNDPRVTSIGKILRKTSIDELPQLANVLRGDMSIVAEHPVLGRSQGMRFVGGDQPIEGAKTGVTGRLPRSHQFNDRMSS